MKSATSALVRATAGACKSNSGLQQVMGWDQRTQSLRSWDESSQPPPHEAAQDSYSPSRNMLIWYKSTTLKVGFHKSEACWESGSMTCPCSSMWKVLPCGYGNWFRSRSHDKTATAGALPKVDDVSAPGCFVPHEDGRASELKMRVATSVTYFFFSSLLQHPVPRPRLHHSWINTLTSSLVCVSMTQTETSWVQTLWIPHPHWPARFRHEKLH